MYKIIGGDQKEYGPVTTDELRRWIAEGRLNAQSLARAEGTTEWLTLASFPEFAEALGMQVPVSEIGVPVGSTGVALMDEEILTRQPQVRVGECLAGGWELLRTNFALLFGASLVYWAIEFACSLNFLTQVVYGIASGLFAGGLYMVFLKRLRGQPAVVTDVFSGFKLGAAQLVLAGFLSGLLGALACCCLVVPGIYLLVAWRFCVALVADRRMEFWSAMEMSRKVVTKVWFETLGLLLLAYLPYILSLIITQIAATLTSSGPTIKPDWSGSNPPDVGKMVQEIFKAINESSSHRSPLLLIPQFVLLLNLPFGVAALMCAYENLFGARAARTA
jgi:hypothetical protein